MTSLPQVSLLLCSRGRPEMLAETVVGILAGEAVPTELVIVDQSDVPHPSLGDMGTDRPCDIRYLWSRSRGLSLACNEGIEAAQCDVLAFTHDDVRVTSDWFGTLVRALLAAGPRAVVTGRVLPEETGREGGFVPSTKADATPTVYEGRLDEGVLYPMSMAMHRSVLDEVGLFDQRLGPGTPFPAAEDNDLCFRLLEAGFRIHYVPEAELYHRAWRTDREFFPLRWSYGRGQGAFYAKHLSGGDREMLRTLAREIGRRTRRVPRNLVREPRRGAGEIIYLAGLVSGMAGWRLRYAGRS